MNAISRFESLLEGMVERSFARLFRARLQPVEIAKRLTREMEAGRVVGVASVLVPNDYEVTLSSSDFDTFAPIRGSLEQEMADYLLRFAQEHHYGTTMPPAVRIAPDPTLRPRRIVVSARMTEDARMSPSTERLERTQTMPAASNDEPFASAYVTAPGDAYLMLDDTTYPLAGETITLGRGLENTIVLEDRRVSRGHATLISSGGHWSVRDEGSTNGTFVNDRMVTQHALKHGDRLSLGGLDLVFHQRRDKA